MRFITKIPSKHEKGIKMFFRFLAVFTLLISVFSPGFFSAQIHVENGAMLYTGDSAVVTVVKNTTETPTVKPGKIAITKKSLKAGKTIAAKPKAKKPVVAAPAVKTHFIPTESNSRLSAASEIVAKAVINGGSNFKIAIASVEQIFAFFSEYHTVVASTALRCGFTENSYN